MKGLRICIYSGCIIIIFMAILCILYEIYKYSKRFKKDPYIALSKASNKAASPYGYLIGIVSACVCVLSFLSCIYRENLTEPVYCQAVEEVNNTSLTYENSVSGNRLESYYEDAQFYIDMAILYYQNILLEDPENVEVAKIIEYLSQIEKMKENELEDKEHSAISINISE